MKTTWITRVAVLLAVTAVISGVVASPASAAVAPVLPVATWAKTGGGSATEVKSTYNIEVDPVAQWWQKHPEVYWANPFFPSGNAAGSYFGLQKRSYAPGKVALFAWWDALDVSCEAVPNVAFCGRFDN